ncbi:MAG TPA: hypothetical protein VEX86_08180 [Longimicrobium sp.]|nr:hypothetical protein [Longimicrobium sp.]
MPDDLATTCVEYGIVLPQGFANGFNAMQPQTFAALRTNRGVFQPVVDAEAARPQALLRLARCLHDNGAAQLGDRVANMVFLNRDLGAALLTLPNQVNQLQITQLRAAYGILAANLRPHLRTFYLSRNAPTKLRDLNTLCAPIGVAGFEVARTGILATICTVVQNVLQEIPPYAGTFDGIARPAMAHLNRMRIGHPPGNDFAGFAQWGEGNHDTAASNQKWHFLKHVCLIDDADDGLDAFGAQMLVAAVGVGMDMEGAADLLEAVTFDATGPAVAEECADWWRALNIRLPWAECAARIHDHVELARIQPWFHGNVLSHAYVAEFVRSGVLSRCAGILAYLMQNYQAAYCNYAIARSTNLDEAIVCSNGAKVFVAGYRGDTFIIGRMDRNGVLGISSCYKPTDLADKMRGAMDGFMWRLR